MFKRIVILAALMCSITLSGRAELETAFTFDYDAADQSSAQAISAARRAGDAQAKADIAAGHFYIIQYGEPVPEPSFPVVLRDGDTGYTILSLHNCEATPAFEEQVRAYNDVVRKWHREHNAKTSNQTMERTAGSFGSSHTMKFHPQPAATRRPASRRSSCSR